MKKLSLLAALVFGIFTARAQDSNTGLEIGLKISPAITTNRVIDSENRLDKDGSKARFGVGLVFDYFFGENYAFSTGLEYTSKAAGITYKDIKPTDDGLSTYISEEKKPDELNVQYLQIPIGFKLFTNEVAPDTRVYFQLGTSINARISSKINDDKFYTNPGGDRVKTNKHFNLFEADAVLGVGAEMQLGANTKVFGGISYHRGLSDIDKYYEDYYKGYTNSKDIAVKNNTVALDLGLKF